MEKTRQENAIEIPQQEIAEEREASLRVLKELELLLVGGGGDDINTW
jgi:hypothetical protein